MNIKAIYDQEVKERMGTTVLFIIEGSKSIVNPLSHGIIRDRINGKNTIDSSIMNKPEVLTYIRSI